ncbi:outer membrane protein assembly factor BamD [Bdellovibrio svalbardensis]|uniref:Tetratricopeptide repeat protein n=1 Tax=Bdellovibrio svalbardensis TaxID=2972972 RepID=A0ABT6DJ28_9BACT|nr:hypothetical protein [Bdellovibrio svalbardensis]MDG0815866.1 hypothetical protein [Bdellovibrio svalbardensis]
MKLVYFALRTLENTVAGHYSSAPMPNVMRKIRLLSYIVLLGSLLSCSAKEQPATRESALSSGFKMLDRQQYDEAIQYFSGLAEKDPHYQVKLAWASAYAARAGVKIETIYAFVTAKNSAVPNLQIRIKEVPLDHQTRGLLANLSTYAEIWNKIPSVGQSAREDLQKAVAILKQDQIPGVRLYSAALRVVILKSSIEEGLRNWDQNSRRRLCLHDVKPYWDWALRVLDGLTQLSQDLEGAFPSKKEFSEARVNLERLRSDAAALPIPAEDQCF